MKFTDKLLEAILSYLILWINSITGRYIQDLCLSTDRKDQTFIWMEDSADKEENCLSTVLKVHPESSLLAMWILSCIHHHLTQFLNLTSTKQFLIISFHHVVPLPSSTTIGTNLPQASIHHSISVCLQTLLLRFSILQTHITILHLHMESQFSQMVFLFTCHHLQPCTI